MPKHVQARAAQDEQEARQVHKLAQSHHAPADWKFHAQMVVSSWTGQTPNEIAAELHCHPHTVRVHLARRERVMPSVAWACDQARDANHV
jgi:DNA-binding NarL/FixJ family response regulator